MHKTIHEQLRQLNREYSRGLLNLNEYQLRRSDLIDQFVLLTSNAGRVSLPANDGISDDLLLDEVGNGLVYSGRPHDDMTNFADIVSVECTSEHGGLKDKSARPTWESSKADILAIADALSKGIEQLESKLLDSKQGLSHGRLSHGLSGAVNHSKNRSSKLLLSMTIVMLVVAAYLIYRAFS